MYDLRSLRPLGGQELPLAPLVIPRTSLACLWLFSEGIRKQSVSSELKEAQSEHSGSSDALRVGSSTLWFDPGFLSAGLGALQ